MKKLLSIVTIVALFAISSFGATNDVALGGSSGYANTDGAVLFSRVLDFSKSTLTGARIKERKPCGNAWYSLCEYKISSASSFITNTLKNEAKRNVAMYNKIEAKIGFNELEKEIEKAFGKK